MTPLLSAFFVLACIVGVVWLAIRGPRSGPFSLARAATSVRSLHGGNFALILAVVAIAQAVLDLAYNFPTVGEIGASAIAVGAVALVAALVLAPRLMTTAITVGAIGLSVYSIAHVHGSAYAVALIAIVLPLLWILGLLRGFIRLGA